MKVNLPIFKDEKTKDAVTYHSWCWDIAIFYPWGWDDQHLLPYIFQSLQGFPGDLSRSLDEDATLTDILQTLDKHYGMVMIFDTLSKEFYSLKQGFRENVAEFGVCLSQQVQILQSVPRKDRTGQCGGDEMRSFLQGSEPWISVDVGPQRGRWVSC